MTYVNRFCRYIIAMGGVYADYAGVFFDPVPEEPVSKSETPKLKHHDALGPAQWIRTGLGNYPHRNPHYPCAE